MRHSKTIPVFIALLALSLALMGCNLLGPAVQVLTPTPQPHVIEKIIVATPTPLVEEVVPIAPAPTVATTVINIAPGADLETQILKAVYEKVNPSVVYIENLTSLANRLSSDLPSDLILPESQASGFVWDLQGHIVTSNHVVTGADKLEVTFADGIVLPAEVVGTDPDSDLAVIKVDPRLASLAPVEQGDIKEVQVGQRAIAIGNPFGLVGTMTSGIVSAIGRSIPSDPNSRLSFNIPEVIQTDAAINPGNSGGPLLNDRGQVIGVNAQIRSQAGSNSGVGFAIPINIVQRVVPALITDGRYRHAYLGISGRTYSPAWADALGFPQDARGAYVMTVTSDGPAEQAGVRPASQDTDVLLGVDTSGPVYLQSGGDLIVAIDNQPVISFDDLLVYLESYKSPGDQVKLIVLRAGGEQVVLTVKLSERPSRVQ
jgi:2-alkenal reductase